MNVATNIWSHLDKKNAQNLIYQAIFQKGICYNRSNHDHFNVLTWYRTQFSSQTVRV
jgi:hypothetical protein